MDEIDWESYSWVVRGKQRRMVIAAMTKPMIPTEIRNETKLSITHVSKVLKAFNEKGVVKCLTPGVRIGKIYELTSMGKPIRQKMLKKEE